MQPLQQLQARAYFIFDLSVRVADQVNGVWRPDASCNILSDCVKSPCLSSLLGLLGLLNLLNSFVLILFLEFYVPGLHTSTMYNFTQGWASVYERTPEKDKDVFLFEHVVDVLRDCNPCNIWARIRTWPPTVQSELFLKHAFVGRDVTSMVLAWPHELQMDFFLKGGRAVDAATRIKTVRGWPHELQEAYYKDNPPNYDLAVDEAACAIECRFQHQLHASFTRCITKQALEPLVPFTSTLLATHAFVSAGYRVPAGLVPPECECDLPSVVLPVGFEVYHRFHGVHSSVNRAWFKTIMSKVIARVCLRFAVEGVEELHIID